MLHAHIHDIARRHLRVLTGLSEMSQQGEIVADLVRTLVRRCVYTMQAVGADHVDIQKIFGCAVMENRSESNTNLPEQSVFNIAHDYLELLLFFEEKNELVISEHSCVARARTYH